MGLFGGKQGAPADDASLLAEHVFDEQFREELRELSRTRLKEMIDQHADVLKSGIDETASRVAGELKEYMTTRLDNIIAGANTEITRQLQERISEYNRLAVESQNLASHSLTRDSQTMFEKYQRYTAALQETISKQEAIMATTLQDSKNRVSLIEQEQYKVLTAMQEAVEVSRREAKEVQRSLTKSAYEQTEQLSQVYKEQIERLTSSGDAHVAALNALQASTQNLESRQQQLSEFLDTSIASQKAMLVQAVNENTARIVEHYLIGVLGDESEVRAQLPSILHRLEENKQAMMDDMTL